MKHSDKASAEGDFWDFCLKIYAKPHVAQACLALQERFNTNVPLLLCGAWMGYRNRLLTQKEADDLKAAVAEWQSLVVEPLRAIRTRLKTGPLPAPSEVTGKLRDKIKACELQAEHIEIDYLQHLVHEVPLAELALDVMEISNNLRSITNDEAALPFITLIAQATFELDGAHS